MPRDGIVEERTAAPVRHVDEPSAGALPSSVIDRCPTLPAPTVP